MDLSVPPIIQEYILSIRKRLTKDRFHSYWPGFVPYPFAFYDDKRVFLSDHPAPPNHFTEMNGIWAGPRDSQYFGNTAIQLNGEYTAIWNLDTIRQDTWIEKLFSLIVHEMYHAFQGTIQYRRNINELQMVFYPHTVENTASRNMERMLLLQAIFEKDLSKKQNFASRFIGYREHRRTLLQDYLNFELGQESMEGLAQYVEAKALMGESNLPREFILAMLAKDLAQPAGTMQSLRRSCYSSGMAVAFLLDDLVSNWHEDYLRTTDYIYDYFIKQIKLKKVYEEPDEETKRLAAFLLKKEQQLTDEEFEHFYSTDGIGVQIIGNIEINGFDPMNLVTREKELLHKNGLMLKINGISYHINQPAITKLRGTDLSSDEIIFFSKEKPTANEGQIFIPELGQISGNMQIENLNKKLYCISSHS